ncbi:beta propeller repeat protein [Polaromonas glacialis]|uniref:hypothetical protein n=1 Tax=Polaromonas glacialis TaxID=866564 RepID=UPI0006903F9D|nr:hypothetical protein [Polaromonas glacialis]
MNFLDKCSVLHGVASLNNDVFIAVMNDSLAEERVQHAIPLWHHHNAWSSIPQEPVVPWLAAGLAEMARPDHQMVMVGWGGQVLSVNNQACAREGILRRDQQPVSIIRSVAAVDGAVYTAGMRRQVHKKTDGNAWLDIDRGLVYGGENFDIGLNAIDGFDQSELYAVGLGGEIWQGHGQGQGHHWEPIASPTNVHLHSLCCGDDGFVYAGGRAGVLLRGRYDVWEILDIGITETIWGVKWFEARLYLVIGSALYSWNQHDLLAVRYEQMDAANFLCLSCSADSLWAFGRKMIFQYHAKTWRSLSTVMAESELDGRLVKFFNDDVMKEGSDDLMV